MATDKKNKTTQTSKTDSQDKTTAKAKDIENSSKDKEKKADSDATLKEQLCEEKDRVLRLSAEFENYKKRKQRELDEFKKFANETVFKQLLTVIDNLERAISSAEEAKDDNSLLEGVKLTHKEVLKVLEGFSVKPVEALNQPFDPNFHQAVTQVETDEHPENTVTSVLQKGYTMHERLIRPAMVVVSKKMQKETETNTENTEN